MLLHGFLLELEGARKRMKILSIGNSFTHDSHVWLKPLAAARNI